MADEEHLALLKQEVSAWNDWRKDNPKVRPSLSGADLSRADLSGANLRWADLSEAKLSEAKLSGANLSGANLSGADLRGADLTGAKLNGAKLNGADLRRADLTSAAIAEAYLTGAVLCRAILRKTVLIDADLRTAFLTGADLTDTDLTWADLTGAKLTVAKLTDADLRSADLRRTDLTGADLERTQSLGTNFNEAILTGACLEDWNINNATNLDGVICDYVYLRDNQQERRPSSGNFAPGEFTKLFKKSLETVDLIFRNGIDWKAFLTSFQKLQVECGGEELSIQAIENKNDGTFVIRVNVPSDANKAEIEKYLKREYESALKALEKKYRYQLKAKDKQLANYRQQNTDLTEIVKLLAARAPNNVIEVIAKAKSESMTESRKMDIDQSNSSIGIGYSERVQTEQLGGTIHNYAQEQNPVEAAAEIQQLLKQLEETNPTTTDTEKMIVVAKAADEIKKNPTLKARVIGALKSGGTEAFKEAVDNPLVNILVALIEGWTEAD